MKLSYIFDQLNVGELKQTNYGNKPTGIEAKDYAALTTFIQLALTELHTRFNLNTGVIDLKPISGTQDYVLESSAPYITNTFNDNLLKIIEVKNSAGEVVSLNDPTDEKSLYTPQLNVLRIPYDLSADELKIEFREDHIFLDVTDQSDPSTINVDLPYTHLKPLLEFVAARVYAVMPSLEGVNQGQQFDIKFERSCARLVEEGITNTWNTSNEKFESNGWV